MKTLLKSLLVGITFVVAVSLGGMITSLFGLTPPEAKDYVASAWEIFAMNFSAGIILALLLGRPD
ncbi:MAG: hypothetical protein QY329_07125 [Anaerolineales bacterium]|nr:MAG: hypothetical protein QY329_07125 [Anaerolineales bacterium]